MSSQVIEYVLIYIGVILTVILLVNPIKYLYNKLSKPKTVKENCEEGFGIVFKGELVLENNRPLIFGNLLQAQEHVKLREWDKPHAINEKSIDRIKYVYQRWFVGEQRLILHPVEIRD